MTELPEGLLSLGEARELFAATEPLAEVTFGTAQLDGAQPPRVIFDEKWRLHEDPEPTAPVEAWLEVPAKGQRYQLTFEAARQLGSVCRQPKNLQVSQPAWLHQQAVNWWLEHGLGDRVLKLFLSPVTGTGPDGEDVPLAAAQTRATVTPFLNNELLGMAVNAVAKAYGDEAAATAGIHFTVSHDLEHTDFRLVVPGAAEEISGTELEDDWWWPVLEVTNSSIGLKQTTVIAGMMRAAGMGVILDAAGTAGGFKRLKSTPEEAYAWAAESGAEVLAGVPEIAGNLQEVVGRPVGIAAGSFVADLCRLFSVPKAQVERITAILEDYPGELTMYNLANAVARTANMDGQNWRARGQLMTMAGHIVHSVGGRCGKDHPCYRALPPGYEPPA
jgi:hypothetical protein